MHFNLTHCASCAMPVVVITHGACVVVQVDQSLWRAKCAHKDTTPGNGMCRNLHTAIADIDLDTDDVGQTGLPKMVG